MGVRVEVSQHTDLSSILRCVLFSFSSSCLSFLSLLFYSFVLFHTVHFFDIPSFFLFCFISSPILVFSHLFSPLCFHIHERRKSSITSSMSFFCWISDFKSQWGGGFGYSVPVNLLYSYLISYNILTLTLNLPQISSIVLHDTTRNLSIEAQPSLTDQMALAVSLWHMLIDTLLTHSVF